MVTVYGSFSGCGGSSIGWTQAGANVRLAIEFDPAAADIYVRNKPDVDMIVGDIRESSGPDLLDRHGISVGKLDVWEGSPPCSKFSMSGQREKAWNKHSSSDAAEARKLDRVEDLFFDWIRLLGEMRPKVAVAENVMGLTIGVAKGKLVQFVQAIRRHGYNVAVWTLRADRYGVPQSRQRVFIVCVRDDIGTVPSPPKPTTEPVPYGTAIADLPTVLWTENRRDTLPSEHHAPSLEGYESARYWKECRVGENHPKRFSICRPRPDRPCPTIQSFDGNWWAGGTSHPHECRRFSVAELKRICGFPDDFDLSGLTYQTAVGRLGNSVPPPLAQAVAGQILPIFH